MKQQKTETESNNMATLLYKPIHAQTPGQRLTYTPRSEPRMGTEEEAQDLVTRH